MAHTQASVALAIALTLWYLAYQLWLMSLWLWLIALALACSFDHVWRLSKQIFALQLAALAFQLGSSDSRRLLIQEFHLWERSLERSFTLENLCRWLCRCFTVWLFALAAAHVVLKNSQDTE
ncbi:YALI0B23496p [Yarrowia lipolytica CLIB122]|uniref:YALI0B23496p n=2 Tax=Yarrowia lipolytica TaxID=4952 RepID=Q6CDJ3_YARLI|nr:YALI0B23496p [Yarrowia lipolytica CLIB122]AOW02124.1 hypothetical protein YALI1_B30382g [Yarrowia lipolytica]KAJ8052887.1 hypothetical protein LXG23DRAFT_50822 [Yarrowia lipolytica]CAG83522.1 YALI0B23496p [Yarrowia lipolytica CLIB122]|eukprot:XP_501269.1 YALI0B23496p [Yarrowia lipolytica CLIB122]